MITSSPIRRANARQCVLALREAEDALTVGEITADTGLSRPTVDAVLQDLLAAGTVLPAAAATSGSAGRPARRFAFAPGVGSVAALDIGARSVRCLVTDAAGTPLARSAVALAAEDPREDLARAVRETGHAPRTLGVAVPGILGADGRITQSLAAPSLVGLDLVGGLGERLGCTVAVENDIKLAALAEHHLGPTADSIVLVQLGRRVSIAVIVEGAIWQGAHRLAGELGSQRGMRWTASSERGRLTWSTGEDARPLLERAAAGDPDARREIEEFCAEIAPRLATVLLTLDPELVVVGGGLSRAGDTLLDPLRRALHRLLMTEHSPEVVGARLTTDGALVGALGLACSEGSAELLGVPSVPAPWARLLTAADPHPAKDIP
ncbi:ROK family protein [Brachybacterium sp. YJGR34]|uniref:ROK family protein n=1 Tax=Brachybacterium sp. YJGR34 TaxID=2059911 RepID=UPI000E0B2321|nr:ROK family transcriptional regulator [Brachybacterium sp. YJGR34]